MTRIDLGALVSRAMAIWLLVSAFYGVPAAIESFIQPQHFELRVKVVASIPAVLILIKFVVIWLLWIKAAGFGQWLDKASSADSPPVSLNRESVANALLQGVAAYWTITMIIDLALIKAADADNSATPASTFANAAGFGWPYVILLILSIVLLLNARGVSRKLCTM